MNTTNHTTTSADRLGAALRRHSSSERLQAAMTAGSAPQSAYVGPLVDRCAVESDFFVRDMLTWALLRHDPADTVPRLLDEVRRGQAQARSQALHTLSKIGDPRGWSAITPDVLADADDTVATTAWRAAALLAPASESAALAGMLVSQLGRGTREVQLSLSRALLSLGEDGRAALASRATHQDDGIRVHAHASLRLFDDPDEGFDAAVFEAKRHVALAASPL